MQLSKTDMVEFADLVAKAVIKALDGKKVSANAKSEKTAYQRCEQLLYNYMGFKKIIRDRNAEIEEVKTYGVPKNTAVTEYVSKGGMPHGIILEEESIESRVTEIEKSMRDVVDAVKFIDKGLETLKHDPYYKILEMRYFDGRTQEDIAVHFGCNQATVARNKSRLIKELSMQLFPNQVITEMMN